MLDRRPTIGGMINQNDRQRPGRVSALKRRATALRRHLAMHLPKVGAPLFFDLATAYFPLMQLVYYLQPAASKRRRIMTAKKRAIVTL
jgi:hypothetical protein